MVKSVNDDGSTLEGSADEFLELIKGLTKAESSSNTNEIRVLGDLYEKVSNKVEMGDYIVLDSSKVVYITPGRPYFVAHVDSYGDAIVIDNDDDMYDTAGEEFTVYRKKEVDNDSEKLNSVSTALGEFFVVLNTDDNFFDEGDLVSLNDKLLGGASAEFKRNYDGQEQLLSYHQVRRATSADHHANADK
ncbi:hypothetical protein LL50_05300 [Listeria monocytogenes]|nr:hypothetical protein [Listeria monocytogenes]EAD0383128.1 hypothetical protein [Listeria monocytogenes]EAF2023470.1 hypothetical protein [Listeria monocytogenes]